MEEKILEALAEGPCSFKKLMQATNSEDTVDIEKLGNKLASMMNEGKITNDGDVYLLVA